MKIEEIKQLAEDWAELTISEPIFGFIISHPFSSTIYSMDTDGRVLNLTEEDDYKKWVENNKKKIRNITGTPEDIIYRIYMFIEKPFRLSFVHSIKDILLSEADGDDFDRQPQIELFASLLKDAWITSENPNMDPDVSLKDSINMFRDAGAAALDESEKDVFDNIPPVITLYMGVANGRTPIGLSYTASLEKASWFRDRFNSGGYIIKLDVTREDILAYFNSRGEDEYVVDYEKYVDSIRNQIPPEE